MNIQLHQYPSIWGLTSLSPFCIKLEAFLKYNNLPYKVVVEKNPNKGPKGKMPFININDKIIADSSYIIEYLANKYSLHNQLSSTPDSLAYKSMLEESFYFILLYSRWIDEENFRIVRHDFGNLFLPGYGYLFMGFIRNSLKKQAHHQGISRHSQHEVYELGIKHLRSFDKKLQQNKFFFGDHISEIDFSLYGFFITLLKSPLNSDLYIEFKKMNNLVNYTERLDQLFNLGNKNE